MIPSLDKIFTIIKSVSLADISIFIVQHFPRDARNILDTLLLDKTEYTPLIPQDQEPVQENVIYIAPSDFHMTVNQGKICLNQDAPVNFSRPSIDVLFKSLSREYKSALLAILLCGYGNDGSHSLQTLRANNSKVIIEDPLDCSAQDMPQSALRTADAPARRPTSSTSIVATSSAWCGRSWSGGRHAAAPDPASRNRPTRWRTTTVLRELQLRDFAIAAHVRIAFGPGLNVLTGSTGAGKSLIVEALSWLAGGPVQRDRVRDGLGDDSTPARVDGGCGDAVAVCQQNRDTVGGADGRHERTVVPRHHDRVGFVRRARARAVDDPAPVDLANLDQACAVELERPEQPGARRVGSGSIIGRKRQIEVGAAFRATRREAVDPWAGDVRELATGDLDPVRASDPPGRRAHPPPRLWTIAWTCAASGASGAAFRYASSEARAPSRSPLDSKAFASWRCAGA